MRAPLAPVLILLTIWIPACGGGGSIAPEPEPLAAAPAAAMSPDEQVDAHHLFEEVNAIRESHGLAPCRWNFSASRVAYQHCVDMRVHGFFAHVDPWGAGPGERLLAAGFEDVAFGENLARRALSASAVVGAWLESPTHRATMLNDRYTSAGVGVSGSGEQSYWAQVFIRDPE